LNNKPDISIVIPFYNEEESLKELIPSLLEVIKGIDKAFEIILVDDASVDNSLKVAQNFAKNNKEIIIIQQKNRAGQTGAYKVAFEKAQGEYIIRMDADLQDDPEDLPKFVEKINQGAELIMGLREARKHKKIIRFASMAYDMLILLLFNSPLHSNTGSYVCFKTEYVKNIPWHKNDHRYIPLIAMKRGAKNISEVFVKHRERKYGESKYKAIRKLFLGIPEVIRFLFRYLRNIYDFKNETK